jgi:hypothetical protein
MTWLKGGGGDREDEGRAGRKGMSRLAYSLHPGAVASPAAAVRERVG